MYRDERFGSDPLFLPRSPNLEKGDNRFILAFVHDEKEGKSELRIVNAMNMKLEAIVKLWSQVPYGILCQVLNSITKTKLIFWDGKIHAKKYEFRPQNSFETDFDHCQLHPNNRVMKGQKIYFRDRFISILKEVASFECHPISSEILLLEWHHTPTV